MRPFRVLIVAMSVTLAASSAGRGIIWAGFNNGVIKVTRDEGKSLDDASIPGIPFPARALVEGLATSPTVAGEAYAAVDLLRVGDYAPYLYRTKDFGKTWTKITSGLRANEPAGSSVRTVAAEEARLLDARPGAFNEIRRRPDERFVRAVRHYGT